MVLNFATDYVNERKSETLNGSSGDVHDFEFDGFVHLDLVSRKKFDLQRILTEQNF